jgi:hypothetical protein
VKRTKKGGEPKLPAPGLSDLLVDQTSIVQAGDEARSVGLLRRAVPVLESDDLGTGWPETRLESDVPDHLGAGDDLLQP